MGTPLTSLEHDYTYERRCVVNAANENWLEQGYECIKHDLLNKDYREVDLIMADVMERICMNNEANDRLNRALMSFVVDGNNEQFALFALREVLVKQIDNVLLNKK